MLADVISVGGYLINNLAIEDLEQHVSIKNNGHTMRIRSSVFYFGIL